MLVSGVNGLSKYNLPDFLLVGAARAGTTSIYNYLKVNKAIFMPDFKEPSFFYFYHNTRALKEKGSDTYISNLEDYCLLFPRERVEKVSILGEASTVYLHKYKKTISNLKKIYGSYTRSVKILISIRNPVERAFSMYTFMQLVGREELEFADAIRDDVIFKRIKRQLLGNGFDYIGGSMYAKAIAAYLEAFDSVKIITYDELKADPVALIKEISSFLDIEFINSPVYGAIVNSGGIRRTSLLSPVFDYSLSNVTLKRILKYFLPHRVVVSMRAILENRMIQRVTPSRTVEDHILCLFREDIFDTANIISTVESNKRVQIVKSWMNYTASKC